MKPLAIDLFCGLGGWAEGFLAEGYDVVGFDIERHAYGDLKYPAQLVLQDVLTLHGSQFRDAACIVASPPCQNYSYLAMPWSRSKTDNSQKAKALRRKWETEGPDNRLFDACFRIQREACEAAGRHIPLVIENVRGAQPWVGRAAWSYGSFYLWGDVPALMPFSRRHAKAGHPERSFRNGHVSTPHLTNPAEHGTKCGGSAGDDWFAHHNRDSFGVKQLHSRGDNQTCGKYRLGLGDGSRSTARKAASAMIAKIPFELSSWIAKVYHPRLEFSNAENSYKRRTDVWKVEGSTGSATSDRESSEV